MQIGRTLPQMEEELQRQHAAKADFRAPTTQLEVIRSDVGNLHPRMKVGTAGIFAMQHNAHRNLSGHLGIPAGYYDRMMEDAPGLWERNVNYWLYRKPADEVRLVRTLDTKVRAILSNRYRIIDHIDVARHSMSVVRELDHLNRQVKSAQITDRRMHIKLVTPEISFEPKVGDVVHAGISISNSEIGAGMFKVEPLLYRLFCDNGMVLPDAALKRFHLGRATQGVEDAQEVFSDETLRQDDKVLMLKLEDTIRAAFDELRFEKIADRMTASAGREIGQSIELVVEEVTKRYDLSETEKGGIFFDLSQTTQGRTPTQWDVANSVTSLANVVKDYDRACDLEAKGGDLMSLGTKDWTALAA